MHESAIHLISRFLVIVTILILLLISFIITILFLHKSRQLKFIKDLEELKLNYDKELIKAQLEMQEETLQYISREIHDNVGQFLSLAKLNLNILDFDDRGKAMELVSHSTEMMTRALEDLRDLSKSLSSDLIRQNGLKKAIEMQVGQIQKTGKFRVIFDVKGNYEFLHEQREIILFRILQEAVNNIVRHSNASEIIILLCCIEDHVKMHIQDNGKGFDAQFLENKSKSVGGGLNNMRKRAKLINAELNIASSLGQGTSITVTTPI